MVRVPVISENGELTFQEVTEDQLNDFLNAVDKAVERETFIEESNAEWDDIWSRFDEIASRY